MILMDDIAALPHGEGKALALSLWKDQLRLQQQKQPLIDKIMADRKVFRLIAMIAKGAYEEE